MADGKRSAPRAEAPPARPDAGAQLEELNDQLARFLQHADQLLEEWSRFGTQVRATVDQELARVEQAVGQAGERAARGAGARLDQVAAERVDRAVTEGLARVKTELDRAGRATAVAAPPPAAAPRALLGAIVLANVLLVALIAIVLLRDRGPAAAPVAAPPDAAEAAAGPGPEVERACATLIDGWQAEAAEVIVRAGLDACGPDADAVRPHLVPPPAIDAGVPMDAPIDARKRAR